MSTSHHQYDIIFAGGGTTASVAAGRLAEADPSLKILIIEAGEHTLNLPSIVQPARAGNNLGQGKTFFFHEGKSSEALGGRKPMVMSAKAFGGGSSVNMMLYSRSAASDYDDWEKMGNPGWGSKDLIPLSQKVETYQLKFFPENHHGTKGPVKVSEGGFDANIGADYLKAAQGFDKTRPLVEDFNNFHVADAYGPWRKYIDKASGTRSDAAHHYIYNQVHNPNLTLLVNQQVVRVIFENKRAVGVEYQGGTAYASRLVVLSCGAFGSPAILERSGIGAKDVLGKAGVQQIVDLPAVGENYQDHNLVVTSYFLSDESDSFDDIFSGNEEAIKPLVDQWLKDGSGKMASNAVDAGMKIRPNSEEDLKELGPAFTDLWKNYFLDAPDKPVVQYVNFAANFGGVTYPGPPRKVYASVATTNYPKAQGYTHITSATDPTAPENFDPRYLEDCADVAVLRWAYKHGREISRRMESYRGEPTAGHPKFPEGSAAAVVTDASGPVPINAPRIVYTKEDDKAIDDHIRASVQTMWHSVGTCALKPREKGGVVDSKLNVYGVQGLKVADSSIAPHIIGAPLNNMCLTIGEKCALIIGEELGIAIAK